MKRFEDNFKDYVNNKMQDLILENKKKTYSSKKNKIEESEMNLSNYGLLADVLIKKRIYLGYADEEMNFKDYPKEERIKIKRSIRKTLYNLCKPAEEKRGSLDNHEISDTEKLDKRKETRIRLEHLEAICIAFKIAPDSVLLKDFHYSELNEFDFQENHLIYDYSPEYIKNTIPLIAENISTDKYYLRLAYDPLTGVTLLYIHDHIAKLKDLLNAAEKGTPIKQGKFVIQCPKFNEFDDEHNLKITNYEISLTEDPCVDFEVFVCIYRCWYFKTMQSLHDKYGIERPISMIGLAGEDEIKNTLLNTPQKKVRFNMFKRNM